MMEGLGDSYSVTACDCDTFYPCGCDLDCGSCGWTRHETGRPGGAGGGGGEVQGLGGRAAEVHPLPGQGGHRHVLAARHLRWVLGKTAGFFGWLF